MADTLKAVYALLLIDAILVVAVVRMHVRKKPELQGDYVSLSFCDDGRDRVTFVVPAEMRADLPKILRKGMTQVINHLKEKGLSR